MDYFQSQVIQEKITNFGKEKNYAISRPKKTIRNPKTLH